MVLRFYNTLTKRKEPFQPARPGEVRMYNCGPTVYHYAHIGNFRAYLFADLLRRHLEGKGWTVRQIMNITDVGHMTMDDRADAAGEDKVEKAAAAEGRTPKEIADFYTMAFFEDVTKLGLLKAYFYPRATDHIKEMQQLIQALLASGHAYPRPGGVYFSVEKFKQYGRLSGNTIRKLQAGKRVPLRGEKYHPHDFALWIKNPRHVLQWPSPWGRGYPGWHIECSAMSLAYLGEGFDLHTGGEDNIFPHHECEIAQAEGAGKAFARVWMHTRHLLVNGEKMSKSAGNFFTLRDLEGQGWTPREVRYLLLTAHYRTRLNFTQKGLEDARAALRSLDQLVLRLREAGEGRHPHHAPVPVKKGKKPKPLDVPLLLTRARKSWERALDDDLNSAAALGALFRCARSLNRALDQGMRAADARAALQLLLDCDRILGVGLAQAAPSWLPAAEADPTVRGLIQERELYRQRKQWQDADRIRDQLKALGILLEDTPHGARWKRA
ncbi:MAG: cysteine--tRNA ligase [Candidatus Aenigmarchaeota archaeon]|nr:cysteine--tRNA ligase [Candidatus Aenigmarchaeota archaeon]